jgi:hypothetical protein
MPRSQLPRSALAALRAIEAHIRAHGRSPSLSELGRALKQSRQRAAALVAELERREMITRTPGQPFGIRVISPDPTAAISDADLINAVRTRGLIDPALLAETGGVLAAAFSHSLAEIELPGAGAFDDLLSRLDQGGTGSARGKSKGEEEHRDDAGAHPGAARSTTRGGAPARRPPSSGIGGPARDAA